MFENRIVLIRNDNQNRTFKYFDRQLTIVKYVSLLMLILLQKDLPDSISFI